MTDARYTGETFDPDELAEYYAALDQHRAARRAEIEAAAEVDRALFPDIPDHLRNCRRAQSPSHGGAWWPVTDLHVNPQYL